MDLLSLFELAHDISGANGLFTHPFLACLLSHLLLCPPLHCCRHLHLPLHFCLLLVLLLLLRPCMPPLLIELHHTEVVRIIVVLFELGLQPVLDVGNIGHDGGKVLKYLARLNGFYIGQISPDFSDSTFPLHILFLTNGLQGFRPKRGILPYPSFSPSSTLLLWINSGLFIPPDYWTWARYLLQSLSICSCKPVINLSVPLTT